MKKNICPICSKEINLSRKQLSLLSLELKRCKGNRYFVPDEETNKIVHSFHEQYDKNKNIQ